MPALQSHNQIQEALARYPLVDRVFELSAELGTTIYLVGGTVRDLVLGRDTHDLDFAVQGSGLELARHIADRLEGYFVPLDRERHTGRVLLARAVALAPPPDRAGPGCPPQHLDIASLRGDDLHADLEGRDFTLNAMAIARSEKGWHLVDPLNGHKDLQQGILRMASSASFESDPVRMLRAVRIRLQFDCTIEPQTRDSLRSAASLLGNVSAERVRDEWFRILQLPNATTALKEMAVLGLLQEVAPPFAHANDLSHALATVCVTEHLWTALSAHGDRQGTEHEQVFVDHLDDLAPHLQRRYTAMICEERSYLALLKCAALLHATSVSGATLADRWKLSKREAELLHGSIHHHADVQALTEDVGLTRRTIYRFFARTGEAGIDAALLFLAHRLASRAPGREEWGHQTESVAQLLRAWFERHDTQIAPTPLLSGKDVMCVLGQQAGPQIGEMLRRLAEEQAAGEIVDRRQALAYVRRWNRGVEAKNL